MEVEIPLERTGRAATALRRLIQGVKELRGRLHEENRHALAMWRAGL